MWTSQLLLKVLFADDDIGLASESVAELHEGFDNWKNILEYHGLRFSEANT